MVPESVRADQLDDVRPERFRKIVSHTFHHFQNGARNRFVGVDATGQRHQWVGGAVHHQRWCPHPTEQGFAVAGGGDSSHLTHNPCRVEAALEIALRPRAEFLLGFGVGGAADGAIDLHRAGEHFLQGLPGWREQRGGGFRGGWRQLGVARGGHDRHQRVQTFRMMNGERLADHAAHGSAADVRAVDIQRIEQADGVAGHVLQVVGRLHGLSGYTGSKQSCHVWRAVRIELLRKADIPIIEADDKVPGINQTLAERRPPAGHLRAEPHHQEQRPAVAVAKGVVLDLDAVGLNLRHLFLPGLEQRDMIVGGGMVDKSRAAAKDRCMTRYDLIIIGAGIVGCSTALALTRRGMRTLNIDALPAAGYGSTSASSAVIRPMYTHLESACIAHEARFRWLDWGSFLGLPDDEPLARYTECGGLMLLREGALAATESLRDAMAAAGVSFEVIDAAAIAEQYPGISLAGYGPPRPFNDPEFGTPAGHAITHGIRVREAGFVSDPQLAARNLHTAAKRLGAEFVFNRAVTAVRPVGSGFEVVTDGGVFLADRLLNSAGPHSARVNALVGAQLPIGTRPLRHEVAYLSGEGTRFHAQAGVLFDEDAGIYQRPDGADMLIGTTDPACDEDEVVDPDTVQSNLTDKWTRQVMRAAQRFPDYRIPNRARGTVGVYDTSPDWIPIYDRTDLPGYYVAIGTSGNQFKNAPVIGDIMAEVIGAEDHDKAPATLFLESIGRRVNLGFFSRRRVVRSIRGVMA